MRLFWWAALALIFIPQAQAACLTHEQARDKWPKAHLVWRTESHCWLPRGMALSDTGAAPKPTSDLPKPANEPPSALERPFSNAPTAEIYFLSTVNGRNNGLEAYPMLTWQQPWLRPESIMQWPLLIDIDRVPFGAWDKRIGQ